MKFIKFTVFFNLIFFCCCTFAQSSTGQMPCNKILEWNSVDKQGFVKKTITEYIDSSIDGMTIQRAWSKLPITVSPQGDKSFPFVINYCLYHPDAILISVTAEYLSNLIKNSNK